MSSPDDRADGITRRSSLHLVVRSVVRLIPAVARGAARTVWTLVRIVAAVWTRRLPVDSELVAASWQLALLGIVLPFLMEAALWCHDRLDPPPAGFLSGLGRALTYLFWMVIAFFVVELLSIFVGMWVSRRKRWVLWWLAPQMVAVFSFISLWNLALSVDVLAKVGIVLPPNSEDILVPVRLMTILGVVAATAGWAWWVLTPSDAERLASEMAAEQADRTKTEATVPSKSERQA